MTETLIRDMCENRKLCIVLVRVYVKIKQLNWNFKIKNKNYVMMVDKMFKKTCGPTCLETPYDQLLVSRVNYNKFDSILNKQ